MAKRSGGSKKAGSGNALAAYPVPDYGHTICSRRIANGYVVTESGMHRGKYFSRETFTKERPKVRINGKDIEE